MPIFCPLPWNVRFLTEDSHQVCWAPITSLVTQTSGWHGVLTQSYLLGEQAK